MLVLTRKVNEAVMIGDAKVTILRISGDRVRIGIEADANTRIVREELLTQGERVCMTTQALSNASGSESNVSLGKMVAIRETASGLES